MLNVKRFGRVAWDSSIVILKREARQIFRHAGKGDGIAGWKFTEKWRYLQRRVSRFPWNRAFFPAHRRDGSNEKHSCFGTIASAHTGFPKDLPACPDEKYSRSDEFRIKAAQLESWQAETTLLHPRDSECSWNFERAPGATSALYRPKYSLELPSARRSFSEKRSELIIYTRSVDAGIVQRNWNINDRVEQLSRPDLTQT